MIVTARIPAHDSHGSGRSNRGMNKHLHIIILTLLFSVGSPGAAADDPNRQYSPQDNLSVSPYYDDREELAGTTNIPATTLQ